MTFPVNMDMFQLGKKKIMIAHFDREIWVSGIRGGIKYFIDKE